MVPAELSPPPPPPPPDGLAVFDWLAAVFDRVDEVVGSLGVGVMACVTTKVDGGWGVPLVGGTLMTDVTISVEGGGGGAVDVDVVVGGGAVVGVVVGSVVVGAVVGVVVGAVVGVVVGGRGVVEVSGSVVVSGMPGVDIVNDQRDLKKIHVKTKNGCATAREVERTRTDRKSVV